MPSVLRLIPSLLLTQPIQRAFICEAEGVVGTLGLQMCCIQSDGSELFNIKSIFRRLCAYVHHNLGVKGFITCHWWLSGLGEFIYSRFQVAHGDNNHYKCTGKQFHSHRCWHQVKLLSRTRVNDQLRIKVLCIMIIITKWYKKLLWTGRRFSVAVYNIAWNSLVILKNDL